MKILFFKPTRFGDWIVTLSSTKDDGYFLVTAFNEKTDDFFMYSSPRETDIVDLIQQLGENL